MARTLFLPDLRGAYLTPGDVPAPDRTLLLGRGRGTPDTLAVLGAGARGMEPLLVDLKTAGERGLPGLDPDPTPPRGPPMNRAARRKAAAMARRGETGRTGPRKGYRR